MDEHEGCVQQAGERRAEARACCTLRRHARGAGTRGLSSRLTSASRVRSKNAPRRVARTCTVPDLPGRSIRRSSAGDGVQAMLEGRMRKIVVPVEGVADAIAGMVRDGDVVITMGAGSIGRGAPAIADGAK